MMMVTLTRLRRDFDSVLAWVEQGESVEISKRGRIIALISPPPAPKPKNIHKRPDFAGRFKRIYGDLVLTENSVVEDRGSRRF